MTETSLKAGAARVDITPPMGVEMCGYGPYEKRVCTEALDPLYARALWLETPRASVVIVSADLCMIDSATRDRVAEELRDRFGVDPRGVMVAATHTHSGPATQWLIAWGERDADYVARLPGLLVQAAAEARSAARPARLGACRRRVADVGRNREQPDLGPLDTSAQLMRVDSADGKPLAAVFNFGAHAVVRYPFTSRISADWPGLAAATIERQLDCPVALFLQGPCGNINGHEMTFQRSDVAGCQAACDARVRDTAERFCRQVLPALAEMPTEPDVELRADWKIVPLPCAPPRREALERTIAENLPALDAARQGPAAEGMSLDRLRPLYQRLADESEQEKVWRRARFQVDAARRQLDLLDRPPYEAPAPVQVLRVGRSVLVGWPGEVFVELGLELRQRSPVPLTFVASLANGNVGYIPTAAAYESQGRPNAFGAYPTAMTPLIYGNLPFRPEAGDMLVEQSLAVLADE